MQECECCLEWFWNILYKSEQWRHQARGTGARAPWSLRMHTNFADLTPDGFHWMTLSPRTSEPVRHAPVPPPWSKILVTPLSRRVLYRNIVQWTCIVLYSACQSECGITEQRSCQTPDQQLTGTRSSATAEIVRDAWNGQSSYSSCCANRRGIGYDFLSALNSNLTSIFNRSWDITPSLYSL